MSRAPALVSLAAMKALQVSQGPAKVMTVPVAQTNQGGAAAAAEPVIQGKLVPARLVGVFWSTSCMASLKFVSSQTAALESCFWWPS